MVGEVDVEMGIGWVVMGRKDLGVERSGGSWFGGWVMRLQSFATRLRG